MNTETIDREMELINFQKILRKMKQKNIDTVKLLGGEPMLHSRISEIIKLSLKDFKYVQIFTNGIISDDQAVFLKQRLPSIKFTFNVMTPGFQLNPKIRNSVIKRILSFAPHTEITLSLTIDPATDVLFVLKTITEEVIMSAKQMRIGFSNPTAGEAKYYTFDQFPKMGNQLYQLVKRVKEINTGLNLHLNCGFTRCMFTEEQYYFLMKTGLHFLGWGCFGRESSMDIATNMTAFHCFPLSTRHRVPVSSSGLPIIDRKLISKRYDYWKEIYQNICKKCPFYGHVPGKCPGPCIAFLMNQVNTRSKFSS
jgi:MoaA/NifB/PqqE/SkfB family radical SAM enzyme